MKWRPLVVKSPHKGGRSYVNHVGKVVWRCAECGHEGFWAHRDWTIYGSHADDEYGNFAGTTCSEPCRVSLARRNGWPTKLEVNR
jgi:hypothetical protein